MTTKITNTKRALAVVTGVALTGLFCSHAVAVQSADLDDQAIAAINSAEAVPSAEPTWGVGEADSIEAPAELPKHSGMVPASTGPDDISADYIEILPDEDSDVPGATKAKYNKVGNGHGDEGGNLDTIWQSSKEWSSDDEQAHVNISTSGGTLKNIEATPFTAEGGTPNLEVGQGRASSEGAPTTADTTAGNPSEDVHVVIELEGGVTITIDAPAGAVNVGGDE